MNKAVKSVLKGYANFRGNAKSSELWYFLLFCSIVLLTLYLLGWGLCALEPILIFVCWGLGALFALAMLLPFISVSVRISHGRRSAADCVPPEPVYAPVYTVPEYPAPPAPEPVYTVPVQSFVRPPMAEDFAAPTDLD